MPFAGSEVVITVGGADVTNYVLYSSARFEAQTAAMPGTAEMVLKDVAQELDFTTGDEWTVDVDGQRKWGGFVTQATRKFAFPVVDTTTPANVTTRQWSLSGVDYNILFDKRIIHNPSDHFQHFPYFDLDKTMGELLRDELFALYLDIGGDGLDTTTFVDDGFVPRFDADGNPDPDGTKKGSWPQQGSYWRAAMDDFSQFGFVYYIDAEKNIHFHEVEDTVAGWGFSDVPNHNPIPSVGATIGMREIETIEDASAMANDAFVWGGSEWAGMGTTVFKRAQNAGSISDHNRWQYAETKFGELRTQGEVTARANVIVSGNTTGSVGGDTARGLAVDQKQIRVTWFGHDVPLLSGVRNHLKPSDVVTFTLYVMSEDGINPFVVVLPLRTIRITFPTLKGSDGTAYVKFEGFFGVQLSDPWWLWKFLRDNGQGATKSQPVVATATSATTAVVYNTFQSVPFNETPNDVITTFTINFAYIPITPEIYMGPPGGLLLLTRGVDYTESDPGAGEIEFTTPPATGVQLWFTGRLAGGLS